MKPPQQQVPDDVLPESFFAALVASLSEAIGKLTGETELAFFDAIAPIVHMESIAEAVTWRQSRYDKSGPAGSGADYINCPMSRDEYERFLDALLAAEKTSFKEWEATTPYFDG